MTDVLDRMRRFSPKRRKEYREYLRNTDKENFEHYCRWERKLGYKFD